MARGRSIRRRRRDGEAHGFEGLRQEGIELVQQLSGDVWTDYNLHDPGVTILEQLVYGLTELIYRARFPVADQLTGEDGSIDWESQALHPPERTFPCRPTTLEDLRQAILDAVPGIDDVWIGPAPAARPGDAMPGLYRIMISKTRDDDPDEPLVEAVRDAFRRSRNLCEDIIDEVAIATKVPCVLGGRVEVRGARHPDDVLTDILDAASAYVAGRTDAAPAEPGTEETPTLEDVFTGPRTARGAAHARGLQGDKVFLADLVAIVQAVDGVEKVHDLWIGTRPEDEWGGARRAGHSGEGEAERAEADDDWLHHIEALDRVRGERVLQLRLRSSHLLRLERNGRRVGTGGTAWRRSEESGYGGKSGRSPHPPPAARYAAPRGTYRRIAGYHSVQHHFPAIYGVGRDGVPRSAPPRVRAAAAQLKGFLLPLEQVMANHAATLHHARDLFSTEDDSERTYRYEALDEEAVPGVGGLYRNPPADFLDRALREFDDHVDRRGRVLDHMLATFGETFTQRSLSQFESYDDDEGGGTVVANKLAVLRSIVRVGRDRVGAFDYGRPSWRGAGETSDAGPDANVAGFALRVGLLLGFRRHGDCSLVDALTEQGLRLVPHDRFAQEMMGRPQLELVDIDESYRPVPRTPVGEDFGIDRLRRELVPLRSNLLSDALLRGGIGLGRYRLGRRGDRHVLVFRPDGATDWWYLGDFADREGGRRAATGLRRYLAELNRASEGLHVVEHVLLRPSREAGEPALATPSRDAFHALRVSVVLPSWTARCRDERFQLLAEETVRLNCPAHVSPELHWLDFRTMSDFEAAYRTWLEALRRRPETGVERDRAARRIVEILRPGSTEASGATDGG